MKYSTKDLKPCDVFLSVLQEKIAYNLNLLYRGLDSKPHLAYQHSPARGLYELHMGWGLRRASHPQPARGYCDGGRDLN